MVKQPISLGSLHQLLIIVITLLISTEASSSSLSSSSPSLSPLFQRAARKQIGKRNRQAACKRGSPVSSLTPSHERDPIKTMIAIPRGGGFSIMQEPAVKNKLFGTPNTIIPQAYPLLDVIFVLGYAAIIIAMPGNIGDMHKLIHIVWASVHVVLVWATNYGVKAFFPNNPKLPLKLMYTFDGSWGIFVALMPLFLDQGGDGWNVFWHVLGIFSAASIPFLDYMADEHAGEKEE